VTLLVVGLLLFVAAHSVRVLADDWRTRMIGRVGANAWKGLSGLVSILGTVLIVWGFHVAGREPASLYQPPLALRHLNALFTLLAFVLTAAAYVPRNHLKAAIGHPMLGGVTLWALGHLLSTGMLRDVALFGALLFWAAADFTTSRRRDRRLGTQQPAGTLAGDAIAVVVGAGSWALFAFWLHLRWIGVSPFA